MGYDSPNALINREHFGGEAGGAATTEYSKWRSAWKSKLKRAVLTVTVAGTATGHGFNLFHGTTSIAGVVLGTAAAGVSTAIDVTDVDLAALAQVSVKSLADQAGKAHVIYVYDVYHDAAALT